MASVDAGSGGPDGNDDPGRDGAPARAYNLGSQTPTTVRDVAERVLALSSSASPLVEVERPFHDHDRRLPDTTRAQTELGWRPVVSLDDGLRAMIADVRARLSQERAAGRYVA